MTLSYTDILKEPEKHIKLIEKVWEGGLTWFFGKKVRIVITGMEGVGKSVLFHSISGKTEKLGYKFPHRSEAKESGVISVSEPKRRLVIDVIPGQDSAPRLESMTELFVNSKTPVDGVLHVVGNGLAIFREETTKEQLLEEEALDTIEEYRFYQLDRELKDLQYTCEKIRQAHQKHHKPTWLLLLMDKFDLYKDKEQEAVEQYNSKDSEFNQTLSTLQSQIGSDFFRWESLIVSGCLETFEWNGETITPSISESDRKVLLGYLVERLKDYCSN